jgi:ABC-type transport system involved in Fe-S cluster assembly fused permease/ATPase subunit
MSIQQPQKGNDRLLLKYLGLTMQIMVSLGLAVYAGLKLDKWFSFTTPLLVWILPLLILSVMMWRIIKDTSKKK